MLYLLAVMLFALTALMIVLIRYVYLQRQALQGALEQINGLTNTPTDPDVDPEMVLTIRVIDPIALAKRESRSARIVAPHMPIMVKKMVYKQVMKEVGMELAERGIESEINVEFR